ncbi:TB2/DP1 [Hexamita inflata]|uniref:HVA22 family protein n=1 Tax=Hexamita inflata TaxID=28002 RepID=A0AA86TSR7_9EUKA|nr:HVA22 family protein [Hexamita inflata]
MEETLSITQKLLLILKYTIRIITAIQGFLYPVYCTLIRVAKLEKDQSQESTLRLQTICNYWIINLLVTGFLLLFGELLQPVFFIEYWRLALYFYLTYNDFEKAQYLYRGVFCVLCPEELSFVGLILPKAFKSMHDATKQKPQFSKGSKMFMSPSLIIAPKESQSIEPEGYTPTIE